MTTLLRLFVAVSLLLSPSAGHDADAPLVRFTVLADRDRHPISELIYGVNSTPNLGKTRFGLLRLGGNRYTAYNWENNASNAGRDYHFQNDGYLTDSDVPGEVVKRAVDQANALRAAALITIPIVDWVSADKNGGGDVRQTKRHLETRFRRNRAVKGAPLAAKPDLSDGFVNQDEFVAWLAATEPRSRVLFSLDNEPDLWASTHPEVHPERVGYDELCSRNLTFARMVKSRWPSAEVTGFVSYGWNGFTTLERAPDRSAHGDFIDYWLDQMQAGERAAGQRLVDYLDVHWYPEAKGGGVRVTEAEATAAVIAARVQAPRSLWDPTYLEASWIADKIDRPLRLIPRLKTKIADHYPGTKLMISEWNFGGGGHISGAVATADVLGIFGREGVDAAAFWELNKDESYALAAFGAYRDFDGNGAAFGDTSIYATTSDPARASLYASLDAAHPERVVLIALNRGSTPMRALLTLAHPSKFTRLERYALTGAGTALVRGEEVRADSANSFTLALPALSVTVLQPR